MFSKEKIGYGISSVFLISLLLLFTKDEDLDLKSAGRSLAFEPACSQTDLNIDDLEQELLIQNIQLMDAISDVADYYGLGESGKIALEGIIYRELLDFGYSPFCIPPLFEANLKAAINSGLRSDSPHASFGLLNTKPIALSPEIITLLPEELRQLLQVDQDGEVTPESLSDLLSPLKNDFSVQLQRSLYIAGAITKAYQLRIDEILTSTGSDIIKGRILEYLYWSGEGSLNEFVEWIHSGGDVGTWLDSQKYRPYDRRPDVVVQ